MTYLPEHVIATARNAAILLTGSAGYLGTELANQFRTTGIDFVGVDKRTGHGPQERRFNLVDRDSTDSLFHDVSPGAVIHSGTHSALAYRDDFKGAFREDLDAVLNLLGSLERTPDTRLIFFSSSYVYSGLDPLNRVDEDTVPNPAHNFGVAKLFFERFISRNHPNSVLFRLSSVFGHGAQRHPNALAHMVDECRKGKRLTVWGDGARKMQYVYLEEVILWILEGLTIPPGLYNLGGVDSTSVAEAATQIARFFDAQVEFLVDKPEGDTLPFMDTRKLREASSAPHQYPFSDALKAYLETSPD